MTRLSTIRTRLTAWYFLCMAAILCVFAFGARFAMSASLRAAVDHELTVRCGDVRNFLHEEAGYGGHAEVLKELREQAMLGLGGGELELWDGEGNLLFRSGRLKEGDVGTGAPAWSSPQGIRFESRGAGAAEYRVISQSLTAGGNRYSIRIGQPMQEFEVSIQHFDRFLLWSAPALLLLAAAGGHALSASALAPVDRITSDARSISIANLASRLEVPAARDELQRLALTVNEMLERIDAGVRRMAQFTGDASHELRAPLTLIRTAAEFSLRGERSREELLEAMRRILRESERTSGLVDNLLTLARADETALGQADLSSAARAAADVARPLAAARDIRLEERISDGGPLVVGDEDALARLLLILLDNAIKYTGAGGRVTIHVAGREAVVSDTGIGISPEDLPKIWDRFWRADRVRSRNEGGAGLGLAIARSIATRHGADLAAESEPGVGSSFTLRLR